MSAVTELIKKQIQDFQKIFPNKKHRHIVRRDLSQKTVVIISAHPDDEVIQSTLALRLQGENGCNVVNIAVTLGSDKKRQKERLVELKKSIKFLKFKNIVLPEDWKNKKTKLSELIKKIDPLLIIAPHENDQNSTHQKTHELVKLVIKQRKVAWSEFWSPQKYPNILVEVSAELIMKQIQALEFHKGEIARNPYHLRLLSWHMDSVRRGSEIINSQGAESAKMLAGQIYRLENVKKISQNFAYLNDDVSDFLF
jgi:N-acetylglucosamine malate deacetylase 1